MWLSAVALSEHYLLFLNYMVNGLVTEALIDVFQYKGEEI